MFGLDHQNQREFFLGSSPLTSTEYPKNLQVSLRSLVVDRASKSVVLQSSCDELDSPCSAEHIYRQKRCQLRLVHCVRHNYHKTGIKYDELQMNCEKKFFRTSRQFAHSPYFLARFLTGFTSTSSDGLSYSVRLANSFSSSPMR